MSAEKETLIECWAIIIMLGIAAYMFIRSHKKVWAGSVLPLLIVPAVNIIYSPISRKVMEVSQRSGDFRKNHHLPYFVCCRMCMGCALGRKVTNRKNQIYLYLRKYLIYIHTPADFPTESCTKAVVLEYIKPD